ncbi:MAG: hypothetical protein K2X93_27025 [Candidatus Obscuribacterales bacterium]|nr:hypothetical protein [Candidatus Obscuribacterales bacterium]
MKSGLIFLSVVMALVLSLLGSPVEATGKPSEVYRQFLVRLYWAKSCRDFSPYLIEVTRDHLESISGQEAYDQLVRFKQGYVAKFRVTNEVVMDDHAFINGEGIGLDQGRRIKAHVKVTMQKENGFWKVKYTTWTGVIYGRDK